MRRALWWVGGASVAFWVLDVVVIFMTVAFLPSHATGPADQQAWCYLTNALFVFVKCSPWLPGGTILQTVWTWFFHAPVVVSAIPYLVQQGVRSPTAWAGIVLAAGSVAGAIAFIVALGVSRARRAFEDRRT